MVVDSNETWLIIDGSNNDKTNNEGNNSETSKAENLWNNYNKKGNSIYHKWNIISFADASSFKVVDKSKLKDNKWMLINSNNLLKIFANYETRVILMQNIDQIIKKEKNVTNELKKSSENGMYKMKKEYNELSEFDRWDRYEMTNEQRAKFAIMFLYIKITKAQNNNKINMQKALSELKIFLENFDENNLSKEIYDKNLNNLKWDIAIDKNCLYLNGNLYACFLNDLFVN